MSERHALESTGPARQLLVADKTATASSTRPHPQQCLAGPRLLVRDGMKLALMKKCHRIAPGGGSAAQGADGFTP